MEKYVLIETSNINEARKEIEKTFKENSKVIVKAQDEEFNRKILENKKVNVIFGFELFESNKRDKLRERNSGLNQVLCKLAKQNDIKIGLDLSKMTKLADFELSNYLARLHQNIRLCNKYKVHMILINYIANRQDLQAFLLTLGMSTQMVDYAINNVMVINHNF